MESNRTKLEKREVVIPIEVLRQWAEGQHALTVEIPVAVDWPELKLTESQMLENAMATAAGLDRPHQDPSIFTIVLPDPWRNLRNED